MNGPISSIFLRNPINFTGMSTLHEWTTPPRAIPSILVNTIPVTGVIFENSLAACTKAFFDQLMHQGANRFHVVHQVHTFQSNPGRFSNSAMSCPLFADDQLYPSNIDVFSDRAFHSIKDDAPAGSDFSGPVAAEHPRGVPILPVEPHCSCTESICSQHGFLALLFTPSVGYFP